MRRWIPYLAMVFVAGVVLAPPARAEINFGGSWGQSRLDAGPFEADDTAYKAFAGFRFFRFFGIEADFVDYGDMDDTVGGVSFESKVKSFDALAVGVIPIKKFEIFGKAGVAAWDQDEKVSGSVPTSTDERSGFDVKYGVGGAFVFSKHFAIRAEWESFELDDDTLTMASLGLELRF